MTLPRATAALMAVDAPFFAVRANARPDLDEGVAIVTGQDARVEVRRDEEELVGVRDDFRAACGGCGRGFFLALASL